MDISFIKDKQIIKISIKLIYIFFKKNKTLLLLFLLFVYHIKIMDIFIICLSYKKNLYP